MAYLQKGYLCVNNAHGRVREGGSVHYPLHRLVYEEAYGVLPRDVLVHHVNEDPLDNRLENLEAVSRADRLHRTHRREGQRRCGRCDEWKDESEFRIDENGKHFSYCRPCKRAYDRERRLVDPSVNEARNARRRQRYKERLIT